MLKVILDPGHGGKDSGAVGHRGALEKDINLRVAQKVYEWLFGLVDVKMTREDDRALGADENADLDARSKKANDWDADIFVSIHCNAIGDRNVGGTETYCHSLGGLGESLANIVHGKLINTCGLVDRKVKTKNFAVLRQTKMPAILIELAFISNLSEELLLSSDNFQNLCARAITEGICEYLGVKLPKEDKPSSQVPSWASEPIRWALSEGLITNKLGSPDFYRFITVFYNYHNKLGGRK